MTCIDITEKIKALRAYAQDKPPIVQEIIEDYIALEIEEINRLFEQRDRYVDGHSNSARRL